MRPLGQLVTLGIAGFGIGRWCIPAAAPIAEADIGARIATPAPSAPKVAATPAPAIDRSDSLYFLFSRHFNARDPLGSAARLLPMIEAR